MLNPYENCPVFENENFCLRLIDTADAQDLFLVYSDEKAVPYLHSTTRCSNICRARSRRGSRNTAIMALSAGQSSTRRRSAQSERSNFFAAKLTIILTTAQFCGWTCEATMSRRPRSMKFYLSSCHRPVNCLPVR